MKTSTVLVKGEVPVWKKLLRIKIIIKKKEKVELDECCYFDFYQTLVYPPKMKDFKQRIQELGFLKQ